MKTLTSKAMLIALCSLMLALGTPLNQTTKANEPSLSSVSSDNSTYGNHPMLPNPTDLTVSATSIPRDSATSTKLAQQEWTYDVTVTVTAPSTGWGTVEIFTNQKRDLLLIAMGGLPEPLPPETGLEIEQLEIKDQWGNDVTWTVTSWSWGETHREFHLNEASEPPYFISYRVNLNRFIEEYGEYRAYCSDNYALFAAPQAILLPKDEVLNIQYVDNPFQVNLAFQLSAGWGAWVPAPRISSGFRIGVSSLFEAIIGLGSLDKVHVFNQVIDGTDYSLVVPRDLLEAPIRLSSFFTFAAEQNRSMGPLLSSYYTLFLDPPGSRISPCSFFGASSNSWWANDFLINNDVGYHEMGHAWAGDVLAGSIGGGNYWPTESFNDFHQWRSQMWPRASTFAKERWTFQASQPPYDYNLTVLQRLIMQNYQGWLEFLETERIPLAPVENIGMKMRDINSLYSLFFSSIDTATEHRGALDSLFQFLRYVQHTEPLDNSGVTYYSVDDLQAAMETLTASSWESFFNSYIYDTIPFPRELIGSDSDGDGLWDTSERQSGTDLSLPDSDGDGLKDFNEWTLCTNPSNWDTDGDGLSDGEEAYGSGLGIRVDGDPADWLAAGITPLATDVAGDSGGGTGTDLAGFYAAKKDANYLLFLQTVHNPPALDAPYGFDFHLCTDGDGATEYLLSIKLDFMKLFNYATGEEIPLPLSRFAVGTSVEAMIPLASLGHPATIIVRPVTVGSPHGYDDWDPYSILVTPSLLSIVPVPGISNPTLPDSDFGGELDGSEVAAGRNPLDPSDDIGDNAPPVAEIWFPLSGFAMAQDSVTVVGTATDNRGIERVEWRIDSGNWSLATGTCTWWAEVEPLSPGIHRLEARAKDAAGNYSVLGLKRAGVLTSTSTFQVLPSPGDYLATTLTLTSSYRNLTADVPVGLESQIKNVQGIPLMGYTITTIVKSPAVLVLSGVTDENGIVRWDYVPPVSGKLEATAYFRSLTATLAEVPPDLPYIVYNPESLTFSCTLGGSNPPVRTLEIWNAGTGTLNWTASEGAGWLSLTPTAGSSTGEHDPVTVSVHAFGLAAGTYSTTISIGAVGAENSPQQVPVNLTLVPATSTLDFNLVAGWNMISLPVTPASTDPNVVFGGLPPGWVIYAWDAANGRYIGKDQIELGLTAGYWLKVSTPVSYPVTGQPNEAAQTTIDLGLGWNLIGVPYQDTIPWGAVRVSKDGGALVSLDQDVSSDWIQNTFFRWSGSAYQGLTTGGNFQPISGYWVKTKVTGIQLVSMKP